MINITVSALLAMAISLASTIAYADQYISGPQLVAYCASPSESQGDIACQAYIMGMFDGLMVGTSAARNGKPFCSPDNVSGAEARRVVEKYIREHPEHLNDPAGGIVSLAFYTSLCVPKAPN